MQPQWIGVARSFARRSNFVAHNDSLDRELKRDSFCCSTISKSKTVAWPSSPTPFGSWMAQAPEVAGTVLAPLGQPAPTRIESDGVDAIDVPPESLRFPARFDVPDLDSLI